MAGGNHGYELVSGDENTVSNEGGNRPNTLGNVIHSADMPQEPPSYEDLGAVSGTSQTIESMEFQDTEVGHQVSRLWNLQAGFKNTVVYPVTERILDPLVQICTLMSERLDYYLNKVGNPLILRRFVYIFFMSFIVYYVTIVGLLPNNKNTGFNGMFSDKRQFIEYAKDCINYAKMEEDLEYMSSMPHLAGTKGDLAMMSYVKESFSNNGLKLFSEKSFKTYLNYPGTASVKLHNDAGDLLSLNLNEENFNPLTPSGNIEDASLIYAHYGKKADLERLTKANLINDNTILMMHYGKFPPNQVLSAQNLGVKGIIFISDAYGDDKDAIQRRPVGMSQYGTGDVLTPGWSSNLLLKHALNESPLLPKIPVIPISVNQASEIKNHLYVDGKAEIFENGWSSGVLNTVKIDMKVAPIEKYEQPSWNIVGKIEGNEQNEKGIIIGAARDSTGPGASYPNFGQMMLLSLVELFQEVKYKYDWKPLRNIYFFSYDGSMYNSIGATELLESDRLRFQKEIYSVVDISQLGLQPDGSKIIDIQANPLVQDLFTNEPDKHGFQLNVRDIQQCGDWSPLMANGIPAIVMSSPNLLEWKSPTFTSNDTFEYLVNNFLKKNDGWRTAGDMLLLVFQTVLKLVDEPLMPFNIITYVHDMNTHVSKLFNLSEGKLDYQPILDALKIWRRIGDDWTSWSHIWRNLVNSENTQIEPSLLSVNRWTWNKKLTNISRRQLVDPGIPGRMLLKNIIFGPSLYSFDDDEDSWTFPSVRDAITEKNWAQAQDQINLIGKILASSAERFMDETTDF
ncbi:uncharacterized protein Ecym_2370 [Eremothecium cymbalariae DBVPG|uniref:Transferrin receptor-like dimerisation domain-containing protein n=1 Tax=Eremothecium cymbalariae (strain CBS 270.75 / DBVPG 7215 / KCTC 17166 / NRRL Y-17582) TaxID=931890 RepID=G8JNN5_ERECY|nr:Hypothetical protein Ecym_2370 [Eremothecium cymbalariae DBVPG\